MEAFLEALDNFFGKLFKSGEADPAKAWRDWGYDYISVVMLILVVVAVVLILTIIIAAIVGVKNKKKRKALQEQNDKLSAVEPLRDSGELRAEIRAEMEPIIREQVDREYRERYAKEEPKAKEVKKEQSKEQPKEQPKEDKQTEELRSMIVDIHSTTQDLKEQIETLTAENTALKNEVAAQNEQAAEDEKPAKKTAKKPAPAPVEDEDDYGEDEYDNEYGDENSALQVSVQYDRMKMNWVVLRSDSPRTYRRCDTKQEALPLAKDLAKRLHAQLVVHKKDGKFQKI
ncbi:MAG: DUF2188 domain-containing protein [Clostridiales bacterium]|nr:DUF2188 domain-containing protein [Clostridiales bacterium]